MDLKELDNLENNLIQKLNAHKALSGIEATDDGRFTEMLLQKRFHSLAFTLLYDVAIDGLGNEEARKVARAILREEYPQNAPSHREDLAHDLQKIGVSKKRIMNSVPAKETLECAKKLFSMLKMEESQEAYDIKAMTVLRLWGEVFVSEEYGAFIKKLSAMGLTKQGSRFYWQHYVHDKKRAAIDDSAGEKRTHSDRFTHVLQKLLDSPEKVEVCAETSIQVFAIKSRFYDQFT